MPPASSTVPATALKRTKAHREFEILTRVRFVDGQRKPVIGTVVAELPKRLAVRRRRISHDRPLARLALARAPQRKIRLKICGQRRHIHNHWSTPLCQCDPGNRKQRERKEATAAATAHPIAPAK